MSSTTPPTQTPRQARPPRKKRTRLSRNLQIALIVLVALLIFGLLFIRGLAGIYTDFLWFDSLELSRLWSSILITRILLGLTFFGVFLGIMWANLTIAEKVAPKQRPVGPEEQALSSYHSSGLGRRSWILRLSIGVFLALIIGVGANNQWQNWLLFINKTDFGIEDPLHNVDLGFYVFQLPFLKYVIGWLFTSLIVTLLFTAIYHYIYGGIRFRVKNRKRVLPAVHAHLSIILAVLALIKGIDYYLGRFELTVSTSGTVNGATYTDVNSRLPVLNLLIVLAIISAVLFVYNIWRRNWIIPIIGVGLWIFVSIVMGAIYPFFIQRFVVEPAESSREQIYITRNIDATRKAIGLDNVIDRTLEVDNVSTFDKLVAQNRDIVDIIPIQDHNRIPQTFENLQGERGFYRFSNPLDIDRYEIDGVVTPVVIGARELDTSDLPNNSWESTRLGFTHGFGVVLTRAFDVVENRPNFQISSLPIEYQDDSLIIEEPRIYIGEGLDGYAIVGTNRKEIDGDDAGTGEQGSYTYTGTGGVKIGGFFNRAAFALRFLDFEPLISDFINDDSRVIYIRNVRERVEKLAPFLYFDSEIYPVIADGRIMYILDGYTTTNRYPYSERVETNQLDNESGLNHSFNYVRNSVKAVVDSFDGSVNFYIFDETDPIIRTWEKAFPYLFSDKSEMSAELIKHIRYPEDLFRIQTNVWATYQLSNPLAFYGKSEAWDVAQDPGGVAGPAFTALTNSAGVIVGGQESRINPYYAQLRLPTESESSYVALRPFVPLSDDDRRKELTAFMVAKGDADNYGELVLYRTPSGDVGGPSIVNAAIQSDPGISQIITLLDQQGSSVRFGEMLLVPIEDSILYVRSLYVEAASTQVPELQRVVAVLGESVVMCPTLEESLVALFDASKIVSIGNQVTAECVGNIGGENSTTETAETPETTTTTTPGTTTTTAGTTTTTTTTTPPTDSDNVATDLLEQAESLFDQADEALRNGDLGRYQELITEARELAARARESIEN